MKVKKKNKNKKTIKAQEQFARCFDKKKKKIPGKYLRKLSLSLVLNQDASDKNLKKNTDYQAECGPEGLWRKINGKQ